MKKVIFILISLLLFLTVLYPMGKVVASGLGYTFSLLSVSAFAAVIALLSVFIIILNIVFKMTIENKVLGALFSILTPLSLVNAVFYIGACPHIGVVVSAVISVGCCCYLTIRHGKPIGLKVTALSLSALMLIPIICLSFFAPLAHNLNKETVVDSIPCPDGQYCAKLIDHDQGAMGGSTLVEIVEIHEKELDLVIFKIQKKPRRVYTGKWGEYKTMEIYWKDADCLVINGVEYPIK